MTKVIAHIRTTEKKPDLTVLITCSSEVAPLITAIEARYTEAERVRRGKDNYERYEAWIGAMSKLFAMIWTTLGPVG